MHQRTQELRALMKAHKLSAGDVGVLIARTPRTVRIWRCKSEGRIIPEHTLELLRLKLAANQGAE